MECNFCGRDIAEGTGFMYVTTIGKISYFCSRKCRRNIELGRKPRRTEWTEEYSAEKKIRIK